MLKMREGSRRSTHSRRSVMALAVVAGCLGIMALPGGASASVIGCSGKLKAVDPAVDPNVEPNTFDYRILCNAPVLSYSIVSNRQVDYFSNTADGFVNGEPNTDTFSCEGPFSGNGFGCHGKSTPPSEIRGQLGTSNDPCKRHPKGHGWKVWVVAVASESQNGGAPFITSSEPFRLRGPGCKAAAKTGRQVRH